MASSSSRSAAAPGDIRALLREIPVFDTEIPGFTPEEAPEDPVPLFVSWLRQALAAGVPEPHVMNVATADAAGQLSSRFLILKDVDGDGWRFASSSASPKGRDLAANPHAALGFYWPGQARQVRVRGVAAPEPPERSAADFLARSPSARVEAFVGGQSQPLRSGEELAGAERAARALVEADPDAVAPDWTLYTLRAESVEFWQADRSRKHIRLRYTVDGDGWRRTLLGP